MRQTSSAAPPPGSSSAGWPSGCGRSRLARTHCRGSGSDRRPEVLGQGMTRAFAVSFDYRCPFARNGHEHLLAGLAGGADWDVTFLPFSLDQVHVAEGEPAIWDRPDDSTG